MDGQEIVINEILCYIDGKIKTTPTDTLKSIILSYYDSDAIEQAKFSLYAAIPRNFTTEAALEMSHEDDLSAIITIMQMIKPEDKPMIVCKDLNNVPSSDNIVKPDPDGPMPVVMKKEQRVMKNQLRQMHNDVLSLKDGICLLVDSSEDPDVEFEDKENFTEYATPTARVRKKPRKKKAEAIYVNKTETLDGVEESIMLQADGLPSPIKKYTNNNGQNVTICHDEEGVVMTMVADDDLMQTGDQLSDAANIEVVEGKPSKVQKKSNLVKVKKEKSCYIIVENCFDENIGNFHLYRCSQCNYCSNDEAAANAHSCSPNKRKTVYTCKFCEYQSSNIMQLNEHLSKHNTIEPDEGVYDCVLCYFKCNEPDDFQAHLMTHSWKKPYKCDQCSYKGYDEYRMKSHSLKHAEYKNANEYECQICLKICGTQKALKRHKMLHSRKYEFQCQYCNITYKNRSTLENHVLSHTVEKSFACKYCKRVCDSSYTLYMHEKVHFRDQTFKCSACDLTFNNRNSRRLHILAQHPDLKPWKCDTCDMQFTFKQSYLVHRNTHAESSQRTVPCPYCNRKFKSAAYMKMHVGWIHHGSKPYWCSFENCNFQSRHKSELNKHEAEHRMIELAGGMKIDQEVVDGTSSVIESIVQVEETQ